MANTNEIHDKAVEVVKAKLESLGIFERVIETPNIEGVDLMSKRGSETLYYTVIGGTKQTSKSLYAAISSHSWEFTRNNSQEHFFVAAIKKDENSEPELFLYTPTEMWARSNKPYVHLKCNPLKKGTLYSLESLKENILIGRRKGEKDMIKKLDNLSKILGKLNTIKG